MALKLRMKWLVSLTAFTLLPILMSIRNKDVEVGRERAAAEQERADREHKRRIQVS